MVLSAAASVLVLVESPEINQTNNQVSRLVSESETQMQQAEEWLQKVS